MTPFTEILQAHETPFPDHFGFGSVIRVDVEGLRKTNPNVPKIESMVRQFHLRGFFTKTNKKNEPGVLYAVPKSSVMDPENSSKTYSLEDPEAVRKFGLLLPIKRGKPRQRSHRRRNGGVKKAHRFRKALPGYLKSMPKPEYRPWLETVVLKTTPVHQHFSNEFKPENRQWLESKLRAYEHVCKIIKERTRVLHQNYIDRYVSDEVFKQDCEDKTTDGHRHPEWSQKDRVLFLKMQEFRCGRDTILFNCGYNNEN